MNSAAVFFHFRWISNLARAEGVSDRSADAKHVIGMKLEVVGNEIPVSLRPNENASPHAVPNAYAGVNQKMRAIEMGAATSGGNGAAIELVIEDQRLATDARHEIASGLFGQPRRVYAVNVVQNRPVGLKVVIEGVAIAERALGKNSEMIVGYVLHAETGIGSPFFGWRQESDRGGCVLGRPECVAADSDVDLLSLG